jgi:nitrate/nitrite transporter NarK
VLSLFVVVQVVVYAGLQLPVGMALDRWGSRRLLALGAALAAVGQLGLVLASGVPMALVARVLVGAGDAATFVSALRLVPAWFPARRVPLLSQVLGSFGQLGQVVSAVPFGWALHTHGWTVAFGGLAGFGALVTVVVWAGVRDRPPGAAAPGGHLPVSGIGATVRSASTWLGFFAHGTGGTGVTVFTLMWGYPFLVEGHGLSGAQASAMLTVCVVTAVTTGPLVGLASARLRARRAELVLAYAGLALVGWLVLLVPTSPAPLWLIAACVVTIALGGPVSLIGLELASSAAPRDRAGTATGVANMGGFVGGLTVMLAVGVVLDHRSSHPGLADYRVAMSTVLVAWAVGVVGILITRWRVGRTQI